MKTTLIIPSLVALVLGAGPLLAQTAPGALAEDDQAAAAMHEGNTANAGHAELHVVDVDFSFEGPFGTFDEHQLQRGLQVFTEVCSACHGLNYVPLRTLTGEGGPNIPADQVRAYAANLDVFDPELGDTRPRKPTDFFPTVTGEGMGPDLSVMAKARAAYHGPYGTGISQLFNGTGGPEYIVSILAGYTGETKDEAGTTFYQNTAFPGGWIAMPPPMSDGQVEFHDGSPNDVKHMAEDTAAFLMWTAEPHMMNRKKVGFVSVIFLGLLSVLLYLTNKKIWAPVKGHKSA